MTYQALARKYRPRNFAEMVGQEHVLRALINALDTGRLHHAFLFTGTRGVGKTTIARILAKSLNCEVGISSKPCGQCSACREIDEGRFVDLIEVDAASRTKVDDTRELLDNVQYAPTRGRYKVYLVDEVHMLSNHSFNALLKTLEEPPPHVKFLFATTDPQKLPVTILSRCLQFSLKRMPTPLIENHLAKVLGSENITTEPAAVKLLAAAADGSMRDALSLMDQAIAFGGGQLLERDVRSMLGTIDRGQVGKLAVAIAAGDGVDILDIIADFDTQAPDYRLLAEELMALLQRVSRYQLIPQGTEEWDDLSVIQSIASRLAAEDVQLYYQITGSGLKGISEASDPRAAFEMLVLRMLAFRPADIGQSSAAIDDVKKKPDERVPVKTAVAPVARHPETRAKEPATDRTDPVGTKPRANGNWKDPDWNSLVDALGLTGVARELAVNCQYSRRDGQNVVLRITKQHVEISSERVKSRIEEALSRFYQEPLKIRFDVGEPSAETPAQRDARRQREREQAARESMQRDPAVKAMQELFSATLDEETIRPVEKSSGH